MQEEVSAQEYGLRISFVARSSDGLRLPADPTVAAAVPGIVEPLSETTVEVMGTPYCGKGEPNQAVRVGHASPVCKFSAVDVFGAAR